LRFASTVWPMTRGTSVLRPWPTNCLISTARTSAGSIWPLRNSTMRRSSGGISSATNTMDPPGLEGGLHPPPEARPVAAPPQERLDLPRRVHAPLAAGLLEPGPDGLDRPVRHRVGGVVEHLADDLAADAGVAAPLDLDQRGDGVLVEEQVVEGPA